MPQPPVLPKPADIQLSPHFWLSEFTTSQTAIRLNLDNTPSPTVVFALARLAALLERVRDVCGGRPIVISSGYRCMTLNSLVGGAAASAHMAGLAADIVVPGLPLATLCRTLAASAVMEEVDQLIHEGGWAHVALAPVGIKPRRQTLTAMFSARGVTYRPGLPLMPA